MVLTFHTLPSSSIPKGFNTWVPVMASLFSNIVISFLIDNAGLYFFSGSKVRTKHHVKHTSSHSYTWKGEMTGIVTSVIMMKIEIYHRLLTLLSL